MTDGVFSIPLDASPGDAGSPSPALRVASGWPLREFVAGEENALARIAAESLLAAESRYNPVVFCGPTGVGKSHLVQGLAERWRELHPHAKAVVATGADFARSYANAVQTDTLADHRERILQSELFVLDGLEELRNKPQAQQELIHTLDEAFAQDVQVMIASRAPLTAGGPFLPGLASRLSAGLTVPLTTPGPAARRAILAKIVESHSVVITAEAQRLLADQLTGTADELRHAMLQLCEATSNTSSARVSDTRSARVSDPAATTNHSSARVSDPAAITDRRSPDATRGRPASGRPAVNQAPGQETRAQRGPASGRPAVEPSAGSGDLRTARAAAEPSVIDATAVRRFLAQRAEQRRPTLNRIAAQVARRFRLKATDLQGKTRRREVVQARGVAMLLARQLTGASYQTVGRHFGNRDHSTVMHACRRTTEQLETDPVLRRTVEELAGSWSN